MPRHFDPIFQGCEEQLARLAIAELRKTRQVQAGVIKIPGIHDLFLEMIFLARQQMLVAGQPSADRAKPAIVKGGNVRL